MTLLWEIDGRGTDNQTLRIWDHTGTEIWNESKSGWTGDEIEDKIQTAIRQAADGNQPSAYNQALLFDAATDNWERGTPS